MKKQKIIFLADTLDIGGIERAILNFLKVLDKDKYTIYLMLNIKKGIYLEEVPNYVKIINFNMSTSSNVLKRKILNAWKLSYFSLKYYHKFDFAGCFSTVTKSCYTLAKRFSKNNAIWIHNEYFKNREEGIKFINYIKANKYKKIVFVADKLKKDYLKIFPDTKQELYVMNNLIDYERINKLAEEKINLKKEKLTLLNVGRHEEYAKRLSILIKTCAKLLKEGYDFDLWLVGDGLDHQMYIDLVTNLKITKNVKFFGKQSNVFPYYKLCDAIVLSSFIEGNPVVYLEGKVMQKPIISTDTSDARKELDGYGIVTEFNEEAFYLGLKEFLDNGYKITKEFKASEYNKEIIKKLDKVIGDEI